VTLDRRAFLGALALPAAAALPRPTLPHPSASARLAELARTPGTPEELAGDEDFWSAAQSAFAVDRSLVNLNNGGVSPSPKVVQEALARHLAQANHAPAHVMWREQEPRRETVRAGLALHFGCDPEEVAIVRNASEGLETCQLGFDLERGDEILTSDQDYPRMLTTFRQRERREGVVLRTVPLPVPSDDPAEVVRRFEEALTERTRLILCCHVINLTGAVLPVRELCALGRARGIPVIVDGAHSFAHFPFRRDELGCDFFATSLHKWLFAPIGTGMLYVRRERIAGLWPLMAADERQADDVRKFEEIGTHPCGLRIAIAEALTFHEQLGPERKAARLRHLRDSWLERFRGDERVRVLTPLAPGRSYAIATIGLAGVASGELAAHLWSAHRILVTPIAHADVDGIRVSPSVYTTPGELERFADALGDVLANGLPS
jgi:selenocysteine lyase/cysteine desulfurase